MRLFAIRNFTVVFITDIISDFPLRCSVISILFYPILLFGQLDTTSLPNGSTIIWVKPDSKMITIWGNPEVLVDRIILDSNGGKISEKISNEMGYIYSDWNSFGIKIYDEILVYDPYFRIITFFDDSGNKTAQLIYIEPESERKIIFNPDNKNLIKSYTESRWLNAEWEIIKEIIVE